MRRRATASRSYGTPKKNNRTRGGFTLIELVIVLIVLALAAAVAIPALQRSLETVRIDAAARRMAAFLDETRRRAVLERTEFRVRCRPRSQRLEAVDAAGGERFFNLAEKIALVTCVPEEMRFHPQGSATGMTVLLRDQNGRERRLTVGAFTGLTRVDPGR